VATSRSISTSYRRARRRTFRPACSKESSSLPSSTEWSVVPSGRRFRERRSNGCRSIRSASSRLPWDRARDSRRNRTGTRSPSRRCSSTPLDSYAVGAPTDTERCFTWGTAVARGRARGGRTGDAPRAVRRGPPAGPHGRRRRPRRARRRSARTGTATRRGRPGRDPGPTAGPLVRGLPSPWATARRRRGFRRRGGDDPGALADGAVRVAVAGSRGRRPSRPVPGRAADGDRPARNRPPGRARSDATDRFI
jgi:hypothetical protein